MDVGDDDYHHISFSLFVCALHTFQSHIMNIFTLPSQALLFRQKNSEKAKLRKEKFSQKVTFGHCLPPNGHNKIICLVHSDIQLVHFIPSLLKSYYSYFFAEMSEKVFITHNLSLQ